MFWRKKKEAKNAANAQDRLENERKYEGRIEEIGRESIRPKKSEPAIVEEQEKPIQKDEKKIVAKTAVKAKPQTTTKSSTQKNSKDKTETAKKEVVRKEAKEPVKKSKPEKQAKQVKEEKLQEGTKKAIYRVMYDKDSRQWKIKKDGAKRVIDSKNTKEEALKRVKELSENGEVGFIVHKKDGKFQKK